MVTFLYNRKRRVKMMFKGFERSNYFKVYFGLGPSV